METLENLDQQFQKLEKENIKKEESEKVPEEIKKEQVLKEEDKKEEIIHQKLIDEEFTKEILVHQYTMEQAITTIEPEMYLIKTLNHCRALSSSHKMYPGISATPKPSIRRLSFSPSRNKPLVIGVFLAGITSLRSVVVSLQGKQPW